MKLGVGGRLSTGQKGMVMNKSKKKRSLDAGHVKFLILTVALTATMGFWNIFSNQDRLAGVQDANNSPTDPPPDMALDLAPLPTVVPVNGAQNTDTQPAQAPDSAAAQPTPALRSVAAPTPIVIQGQAPVVVQGRSDPGSSNGSAPAPTTNTQSSR